MERPGFDRLVAAAFAGEVGAVLCDDASALWRNGRLPLDVSDPRNADRASPGVKALFGVLAAIKTVLDGINLIASGFASLRQGNTTILNGSAYGKRRLARDPICNLHCARQFLAYWNHFLDNIKTPCVESAEFIAGKKQ